MLNASWDVLGRATDPPNYVSPASNYTILFLFFSSDAQVVTSFGRINIKTPPCEPVIE
jgi:hypothetical protein